MKFRLALLLLLFVAAFVIPANAAPLSGTRSVGPTGNYVSITAAIADVQAQTLGGALVLELQPAYASAVETFPLVFTNLTTTAANTLTLRPQTGAVNLVITSADTTAATVDLNGAQFLTLDGRPGGSGTVKQLTIANTSTVGVGVRFVNEASSNTLRFLTLEGVSNSSVRATIVFLTTTGANGNDNNTIDYCDIRDGATTPASALLALGTTTTTAQNNSGNTVSNCNVFNFYSATVLCSGVRIELGNTDWNITGNSFYQTAIRATVASTIYPININASNGNNFTVSGNFIGGSAPSAGGTPWTKTGTNASAVFSGIYLNVGTTTPSSIQGNTITNMIWTSNRFSAGMAGVWMGINVAAGSVNIGTTIGNTVGSGTGTGSISVTTSGTGGATFGIGSVSTGTVVIANNTIGSITTQGADTSGNPSTAISASLIGIEVDAGTNTVTGNIIGSTTTASSLNAATSSTSSTQQLVTGIYVTASSTSASITGNTVANLNNSYVGTSGSGQIRGIVTGVGVNTITGNTVRNLSTTSQNTGSTNSASVLGISQSSTTAGQTVSQNVVHSLANTTASALVNVHGIYYGGSTTTGPNVIARNLVHSLALASTGTGASARGMYLGFGTFTVQNNMVCVGLDASGTSTAGTSQIYGIYDAEATAGRKFYHNSIYVGGTQTSGSNKTYAFQSLGTGNAREFRNNIFVNARGNSGGIGKHYAVSYGGGAANPPGLTANNNIFLASGTGGVLGFYSPSDRATLAAWKTATGVDAVSLNANPIFINPTGDANSVDLHVQTTSPASDIGTPIAGVTNDFDGQTRNPTIPDIGADEFMSSTATLGTLVLSSGTFSPVFATGTTSYTASVSNSTATLTFTPAISDAGATVTVNGGSAATPVVLNIGTNTVTITVTAQDGTTMQTYTVTVTRQTVQESWRFTYFGTTGNTGNAADAADPYHTGVPNLAVFAVLGPNQDPAQVAAGLLPQAQIIGGNYMITFTQPAGVIGVTYGAEWRADLFLGSWTPVADMGTGTTHTFSVPIGSNATIFIRLKVSSP